MLNERQTAAVASNANDILCMAGPGTGKTTVLVNRAARLLSEGKRIWLFTFTNKAAREMRKRLAGAWRPMTDDEARIGTFHAGAMTVLEEIGDTLGYTKAPTIAAGADRAAILRETTTFTRKVSVRKLERIMDAENVDPEDFEGDLGLALKEYRRIMRRMGLVDYPLMIAEATRALEIVGRGAFGLDEIMVDEYQDTNRSNEALVAFLRGEGTTLFAVGDPMQAIYGFRGADQTLIRTFADRYPGAEVIEVPINYRSGPPVIDLANGIAAGRGVKLERWLALDGGLAEKRDYADEEGETAAILEAVKGHDPSRSSVAVLCRTNAIARRIAERLAAESVPVTDIYADADDEDVTELEARLLSRLHPENDVYALRWSRHADPLTVAKAKKAAVSRETPLTTALAAEGVRPIPTESDSVEAIIEAACRACAKAPAAGKLLERFHDDNPPGTLTVESFLDFLRKRDGESAEGGVFVGTIHRAKGLEFETVFLVGLEEGAFPSKQAIKLGGEALEEELRLFYVAVTRAKKNLFVSRCERRRATWGHGTAAREPSRFLSYL